MVLAMDDAQAFRGHWTRSLMAWPDGRRDSTTQVTWLQGSGLFADLRQPPGLGASLSGAACRDALTAQDCLALAGQQGFSGIFEARGENYEWVRRIDLQPPGTVRDIGRLFWRDEILIEEGVETAYTEHWHRASAGPEPLAAGVWLHDAGRNVSGCVLRVGDRFAYVRSRAEAITGSDLASLVAGAGSLQQMQMLVDCEISLGSIGAGWRIDRSSLPYKQGTRFGLRMAAGKMLSPDLDAAGQKIERVWEIVEQEGDSSVIFDAIPQDLE